jgi:hypothetical protein
MTWNDVFPLFTQAGVFGVLAWMAYKLHLDSVRAHQQRANDAWKVAELAIARADERDKQLAYITTAITQKLAGV